MTVSIKAILGGFFPLLASVLLFFSIMWNIMKERVHPCFFVTERPHLTAPVPLICVLSLTDKHGHLCHKVVGDAQPNLKSLSGSRKTSPFLGSHLFKTDIKYFFSASYCHHSCWMYSCQLVKQWTGLTSLSVCLHMTGGLRQTQHFLYTPASCKDLSPLSTLSSAYHEQDGWHWLWNVFVLTWVLLCVGGQLSDPHSLPSAFTQSATFAHSTQGHLTSSFSTSS